MVIITPKNLEFDFKLNHAPIRNIIHYELYNSKVKELNLINNEKLKKIFYFKLLLKSILGYSIVKKFKSYTNKI